MWFSKSKQYIVMIFRLYVNSCKAANIFGRTVLAASDFKNCTMVHC